MWLKWNPFAYLSLEPKLISLISLAFLVQFWFIFSTVFISFFLQLPSAQNELKCTRWWLRTVGLEKRFFKTSQNDWPDFSRWLRCSLTLAKKSLPASNQVVFSIRTETAILDLPLTIFGLPSVTYIHYFANANNKEQVPNPKRIVSNQHHLATFNSLMFFRFSIF